MCCYRRSLETAVLYRTLSPHTSLSLKVQPGTSTVTRVFIRNACSWAPARAAESETSSGPSGWCVSKSYSQFQNHGMGPFPKLFYLLSGNYQLLPKHLVFGEKHGEMLASSRVGGRGLYLSSGRDGLLPKNRTKEHAEDGLL